LDDELPSWPDQRTIRRKVALTPFYFAGRYGKFGKPFGSKRIPVRLGAQGYTPR